MVLQLQLLLLLPAAAFELAAASDPTPSPSTAPVAAVLPRVLGDKTAGVFELHIDTTMAQGFKLENVAPRPAAAGGGSAAIISVTASSSPELAYGAAYYLRTYADMSFSWKRTGGNQVSPPSAGFPKLTGGPIAIEKKAKWSYYQNVCTQSYSMWWWDWARWEQVHDRRCLQYSRAARAIIAFID